MWDNFKDNLCEDIRCRIRHRNQDFTLFFNDDIYNQGLILIENKLIKQNDKRLSDFCLPSPTQLRDDAVDTILTHLYDTNKLTVFVNELQIKSKHIKQ